MTDRPPMTGEFLKRVLVIGSMCMAQSFPYAFLASAVPAIFRKNGLPLEAFWIFSLPLIPYWAKILWAPLVDTTYSVRLGRRKSWILPCTMAGASSVALIGIVEPDPGTLGVMAALLLVHALIMSTQDIAVDAYTLEHLAPAERGIGSSVKVLFEAAGEFAALAGLVFMYDQFGWQPALAMAGALLILFTLPMLVSKEQHSVVVAGAPKPSLGKFFARRDTPPIGALLIAAGLVNGAMAPVLGAMLVDLGYPILAVGLITGTVASVAAVAGALLAGTLVTLIGLRRLLAVQLLLGPTAFLPLLWLAGQPPKPTFLAIACCLTAGMAIAQLHLIMTVSRMGWASAAQAGTDFVAHGTLYNIGRTLAAGAVGGVAAALGWPGLILVLAGSMLAVCGIYLGGFNRLAAMIAKREALTGSVA